MFKLFSKRSSPKTLPFKVDIHSHLLPGLDDGVKSVEETIYILKVLKTLGYEKVITTPHVMSDHYPNTEKDILIRMSEVNAIVKKYQIGIQLEAAAEYYLDEHLNSRLLKGEKLLTFHENFLLFETAFINKPAFLEEAVFNMNTNGYQPVLAHPERYIYLQSNKTLLEQLKNMNVLFQVNLLSLFGYYSVDVKKNARNLIKMNAVDLIGTDCHNALQADEMKNYIFKTPRSPLFSLKVLNPTLL
jgi:tyrosine-protein phosphatase YwqE